MEPEPEWIRLHPLSPLVIGGRYAVFAVVSWVGNRGGGLVQGRSAPAVLLEVLGLALVAGVLSAAYAYAAWRVRAYRVTAERVELRTGVVFRSHRHLPLERIESVDTVEPFVPRLFGLAEVRIEAISSGGSEMRLRYLAEAEAERVRVELSGRRSRRALTEEPEALPAGPLLQVPPRELLIGFLAIPAVLLTPTLLLGVVIVALATNSIAGGLLVMVPILVTSGSVLAARIERMWSFRVEDAGGALVIRRGLLNLSTQRIVTGRVQGVRVEQSALWRAFGRFRVVVDVAGYRGATRGEAAEAAILLPVAPVAAVRYLLRRLDVIVDLANLPLVPPPDRARWRAPLRWRRYQIAWTASHAVDTSGMLWRRTSIVPRAKVQSARITQGPWQRALGLATLRLDTAGTRIAGWARHRAVAEIGALADRSVAPGPGTSPGP